MKRIAPFLIGLLAFVIGSHPSFGAQKGAPTIVTLSWAPTENSVEYILEVSASQTMVPRLAIRKSPKTQIAFQVEPGSYYLRVRGVGARKELGPWSEVRSFVVNDFPPKIIGPNGGEKFVKFVPPPGINMEWQAGFPGTKYAIEIRENDRVIVRQGIGDPKFAFKPTKAGIYKWRTGYEVLGEIQWADFNSFQVERTAFIDPSLGIDEAVILTSNPSGSIPGLEWKALKLKVQSTPEGDTFKLSVIPDGKLGDASSTLAIAGQPIPLAQDATFHASLPLSGFFQTFEVTSRGPKGDLRKETVEVIFPHFNDYMDYLSSDYRRKHFFNTGVGITTLHYQQTRVPDFHQTALTGKLGYRYVINKKFDFGATAYLTLLPLARSRQDVSAQFFGFNMRGGWLVPNIKKPWGLSLMGGAYYASAWVSTRTFGYANIWGPQLFPVIMRQLNNASSIAGYFKFSPITDRVSVLALGNHEMATGLAWTHSIKRQFKISTTLDAADFILRTSAGTIHSSSLTLGVAYNW